MRVSISKRDTSGASGNPRRRIYNNANTADRRFNSPSILSIKSTVAEMGRLRYLLFRGRIVLGAEHWIGQHVIGLLQVNELFCIAGLRVLACAVNLPYASGPSASASVCPASSR